MNSYKFATSETLVPPCHTTVYHLTRSPWAIRTGMELDPMASAMCKTWLIKMMPAADLEFSSTEVSQKKSQQILPFPEFCSL